MSILGTDQDEGVDLPGIAEGLWPSDAVRTATLDDAVDGIAPRFVFEPADALMLSGMLRWSNAHDVNLVIRGAGTQLAWGTPPVRVDAALSTARLSTSIEHHAGDLTATIAAGVSLGAANALLRRTQQWLPLDPPTADTATIGGLVATNDSGPRRQRFGTPRDLIIGIEIALADGRLAKAGGRVVKNVAGYDLARLLCGSFGCLAVIVNATFKLSPLPEASRTVVADLSRAAQIADIANTVTSSQLAPSAVELELPSPRMLIRFETTRTAADQQAEVAAMMCRRYGGRAVIVDDEDEAETWNGHSLTIAAAEASTLVRISILPTDLGHALDNIERTAMAGGVSHHVIGRAGLGVLVLRLQGRMEARISAVHQLRELLARIAGRVMVTSAEPELRARLDPWGTAGASISIMHALKQQFDPKHILNPGRVPWGL
jgi:glycolate oxidase FAD binding subunit